MTQADAPAGLRQLFDDLVRFETILWNALDERLQAGSQTTIATVNLLLVVDAHPLCRVQDIANALAITVGGASQAVDRLEKSGLCARTAHPSDRRSSLIRLTAAGAELLARATPVFDDALHRLLAAPLAAPALSSLAESLRVLRQSATAAPAQSTE